MLKRHGVGLALAALVALVTACGPASGTATTTSPGASGPTTAPAAQPTSAPTLAAATLVPQATVVPTLIQPTVGAPTSAATRAPTSAATAAGSPTQGGATTGSPVDMILNASRNQLSSKSFRTKTTTTGSTGTQTTSTFEYVNPDRVHIITGNGMETIVIKGVGTYTKTNGKWAQNAVDLSSVVFGQYELKAIEDLQKSIVTTNVKLVGPDVLAGRPVIVITYDTLVKAGGVGGRDLRGSVRLWLGATDGLPYQRESTQDSAVTEGAKITTLSVFEYDPTIKIEKPV